MAEKDDPVSRPHSWDNAVSAAYLRLIGHTQEETAESVGMGVRTLIRWEQCSWWPQVEAEAQSRWLAGLRGKTMAALTDLVGQREPATVRFVAERQIRELAPPLQRIRQSGSVGSYDPSDLTDEELERIRDGEDPDAVVSSTDSGG